MNRLAILGIDADEVASFLRAAEPNEQGCFLLVREGRGHEGTRFVTIDPILPPDDAWDVQEPDRLRPSAQWLSAALGRAIEARAGLLFIHAHPDPRHPPALSPVDLDAMTTLAAAIGPILDGPFGAAVVHPAGWVASMWTERGREDVDQIVRVGRTLRSLSPVTDVAIDPLDARQRDALGRSHQTLRSLTVGIVGAGGLGSPCAEQVVRMGVARTILLDHDLLDTPSNLRRIFGARAVDLRASQPLRKVDVVGAHLDGLGFGGDVVRVFGDVRTEDAFRHLLDADIVVLATDTHGSRAIVNELASAYLLPVIDVGVRAGSKTSGDLAGLAAEVRVLTPTTPCLWCRRAISSDTIRAENLPPDQRERLAQEGYLVGTRGGPEPSVVALTVLGAGLAASAVLGLLTEEGEACPSAYVVDGLFGDGREVPPVEPVQGCRCRSRIGLADSEPPGFITGDRAARPDRLDRS